MSSRPEMFCKRGVPRNFAKFTAKLLRQSLFFNKLQASGLQLNIKKETLIQLFSSEFSEISKNTVLCRTPLVAGSVDVAVLRDSLLFGHWEKTYLAENLFITASVFSYFVTVNTAQLLE